MTVQISLLPPSAAAVRPVSATDRRELQAGRRGIAQARAALAAAGARRLTDAATPIAA